MNAPIETLTPAQIVAELDTYIVGQNEAKRAVAVALRNRYRRQQLSEQDKQDIVPKNILMIGPTGVGKTEIARRLAQLARAPFVKVEATKFTEVGYVGRDVDSMIRDLAANSVRLVEAERKELVREAAHRRMLERIADQLSTELPEFQAQSHEMGFSADYPVQPSMEFDHEKVRARLIDEVDQGLHDEKEVDVEIEEQGTNFLQVFTPGGMEEMGLDMLGANNPFGGSRSSYRRLRVKDAKPILEESIAKNLIEPNSLNQEAIHRAEQTGIVFIDEIDKVAIKSGGGSGPDVSREGVQRDLLPVIEGSTVATKFGALRTDHILFVCAGAFHISQPSDLIPELQGRLPIRVQLNPLGEDDFGRILREPKNAIVKQYQKLLEVDGTRVSFTPSALDEVAHFAVELNKKLENIGARRLHTLMEKLLEDLLFEAPDCGNRELSFDVADVRKLLGPLVENADQSKNLL
ncbi:MAG: ATP-dependent protease ATPase subunit HslU [Fimbriimonadaceae bacterium]|nr:ATP-dependent protease ATPase subunit HslU [Fimbriimonadaceae bacterium]